MEACTHLLIEQNGEQRCDPKVIIKIKYVMFINKVNGYSHSFPFLCGFADLSGEKSTKEI